MTTHRIGFWLAHVFVLGICAVLLGAFLVQFVNSEMPCPLCILQRMAMMLAALGPAYVIVRSRSGQIAPTEFSTGYGMSIIAALAGAAISTRQILLHIVPPDPGYGEPLLGLHLYTWALITFLVVIAFAGFMMLFARELAPSGVQFGLLSRITLWALAAVIVANLVVVFAEEGFHWVLPDDPTRYELFH